MQLKQQTLATALAILLLSLSGCGNGLVSVEGTVKIDEKFLPRGAVSFHPVGGGAVGYGTIQSDGSFVVKTGRGKGIAPGDYGVTVVATTEMPKPTPENPEPVAQRLIPAWYGSLDTSGLQYTVSESGGQFDIVLRSK